MFHLEISAWSVAARTAIVYIALLLGFRLAGKREMGQMTPFDLVVILLIANAVQNAMVGPDTSVLGGLIAAAVLLTGNYALAAARDRVPWLRRAIEGEPTLLVRDGKFDHESMRREDVDEEEVMMAMREHGINDVKDVRLAVLETDGSISIVTDSSESKKSRHRVRFIARH
jgi:uncharacterized membrane protein YcaP (DUF421 family)